MSTTSTVVFWGMFLVLLIVILKRNGVSLALPSMPSWRKKETPPEHAHEEKGSDSKEKDAHGHKKTSAPETPSKKGWGWKEYLLAIGGGIAIWIFIIPMLPIEEITPNDPTARLLGILVCLAFAAGLWKKGSGGKGGSADVVNTFVVYGVGIILLIFSGNMLLGKHAVKVWGEIQEDMVADIRDEIADNRAEREGKVGGVGTETGGIVAPAVDLLLEPHAEIVLEKPYRCDGHNLSNETSRLVTREYKTLENGKELVRYTSHSGEPISFTVWFYHMPKESCKTALLKLDAQGRFK